MTKHFTMTGMFAGTTFCLSYFSKLGEGSTGTRNETDSYAHYAYAPDAYVNAGDVCKDCKHVADCDEDTCSKCRILGYGDK